MGNRCKRVEESYLDERHIVGDGGERGKELAVCGKLEVQTTLKKCPGDDQCGGHGVPNLGWGAQAGRRQCFPLPVLGLLDVEVGDHDHGADHDDPDQGSKQDERGGEGVEHLDKEETEDKEKNGDRGTWTNGRGSSEDEVGGRGSARCASKVKSAKQLERLVAGSEEWSSRRSRLEVEVKTFPSGDKLLMCEEGKT